jgi:hypothetical protein
MTTVSKRSFATAPFLVGALLLLCALTFYYFAVLKIDYEKTALLDFDPHTDAEEYFAQAKAMLKDGWPSVRIGYDKLPSRYPFGYPALMVPWLKILPEADSVLAPFRTNQTLGLLFLLSVFAFYLYLAMPVTGGCAVLLLATLPGFFTFCRSSLSEISASALIVLAFMFAYLGLKEGRRWKIYLMAIFLGLSLSIRIQSVFFAPLLLAMALFPMGGLRLRWFLHCAAVPIIFAVATSPVLMLNYTWFHNPFSTGYEFWVPGIPHLFSIQNIAKNAVILWREFALRPNGYATANNGYATANIFGTGTSFVAAFIILICVGFFFVRFSRFVGCAFLAGLSFLAVTVSYKFGEGRCHLPLLILLVAVAVLPVTWAARNLFVVKHAIPAVAILVLFVAACLGYPSRSGYNTIETDRSQTWDALHFTNPPRQSTQFVAQRHFCEMFRRQPGIVLSDIDPVYLNALLPEPFVSAPLDGKHYFRYSRIWRYDRPQALALIKRGLDQSLPIYALFVSTEKMTAAQSRLPTVPGYQWTIFNNADAKAVILKLAPAASEEKAPL